MAMDLTPLILQPGISNDQTFADDVASLLKALEAVRYLPYLDDKGIPTVGIGINLKEFAAAYIKTLNISDSAESIALENVLRHTYGRV